MLALIRFFLAYHLYIGPTFGLSHTHALRPQEVVSAAPSFTRSPHGMVITWKMRF